MVRFVYLIARYLFDDHSAKDKAVSLTEDLSSWNPGVDRTLERCDG
jgi:hypothetical protein